VDGDLLEMSAKERERALRVAKMLGLGTGTVQRIKLEMTAT
jgi:hypothetical protein